MSVIADCISALSAKIQAATSLTPSTWPGDEAAWGTPSLPAVYIHYAGSDTHRNEIVGGGIVYDFDPCVVVYVMTTNGTTGGDAQAYGYLDQVRDVLTGYVIPGIGKVQPWSGQGLGEMSETCLGVHQGVFLYGQGWTVETMQ